MFGDWRKDHKTDCYFYHEEQDMGASIPCCNYALLGLGQCPCNGCKHYISKIDADRIIREKVKDNITD